MNSSREVVLFECIHTTNINSLKLKFSRFEGETIYDLDCYQYLTVSNIKLLQILNCYQYQIVTNTKVLLMPN